LLRADNLKAGHLAPLSFEVADGACLSVEGPSGSGKTRLLRAIADLDPAGGHVFLDGAERNEMPATEWRRLVTFVAAEPGWWGDTGRQSFPRRALESPRLTRLLGGLGLDPTFVDRPIAELSSGERQRLALVRALGCEPKALLLDEATAALDPVSAALVEETIRFQLLAGRSVVLVTHDRALANRLATARLPLTRQGAFLPQGASTDP
jgi:ABC-type iron transport system FetAB ATPase subunit